MFPDHHLFCRRLYVLDSHLGCALVLKLCVNVLQATAIGESVRYQNERNVNILLDICNSRDRYEHFYV